MSKALNRALVWLRRDLRAADNAALYHALRAAEQVWCAFVYDTDILDALPRLDRRVEFIHDSVQALDDDLRGLATRSDEADVRLLVRHGPAREEIVRLAVQLGVQAVYANHDDDPFARARDAAVRDALAGAGIAFHTGKDHVIFERSEIMTQQGTPFGVFTPYKNAWLKKLEPFFVKAYPVERHARALAPLPGGVAAGDLTLQALGFERTNLRQLGFVGSARGAEALLDDFLPRMADYTESRNFPALDSTSHLSVHLRFGTVSIRELARRALARQAEGGAPGAGTWLSELIWRDFYHQVLHHRPRVAEACFNPKCDRIRWDEGADADARFTAWCNGATGYPLIDAAMAQINQTGFMHNRLRMVTASFLTKDLGIDYRRGEAYFARQLNDYDLAANNGGWQWAASTGSDPQPWFRVFSPLSQSQKFDPDGAFIRRWLPQLARLPARAVHAPWLAEPAELAAAGVAIGSGYPLPIVDHAEARQRTLQRFSVLKQPRDADAPAA